MLSDDSYALKELSLLDNVPRYEHPFVVETIHQNINRRFKEKIREHIILRIQSENESKNDMSHDFPEHFNDEEKIKEQKRLENGLYYLNRLKKTN